MQVWRLCSLLLTAAAAAAAAQPCPGNFSSLPDFGHRPSMLIGIGAQKCGSTLLFNSLKHHPQIRGSHTKELFEFSSPDFQPSVERYTKYLRHWGTAAEREKVLDGTVFMEYTPKYMMDAMAPCRVKQFFPDAKFIVSLRDPTYRLFSALNMARGTCLERVGTKSPWWPSCCTSMNEFEPELDQAFMTAHKNFDKCLNTFADDPWRGCPLKNDCHLTRSLYAPQLARWFKIFDPSQFIIINARDLLQDFAGELERIAQFAGLTEEWTPPEPDHDLVSKFSAPIFYMDPKHDELMQKLRDGLEDSVTDLHWLLEMKQVQFSYILPEHHDTRIQVPIASAAVNCCGKSKCTFIAGKRAPDWAWSSMIVLVPLTALGSALMRWPCSRVQKTSNTGLKLG